MVQSLLRNPAEQERLMADTSLVPGAVEETLRWWTPVRSMAREVVQPIELGGRALAPGDGLLLLFSAGNRDRSYWGDDVDTFDIARPDASRNLGFGFGEHYCLGVHLARRESRVLFEELLRRVRRIEPEGSPTFRRSTLIAGFEELPVTLVSR
jgi:cytochrome P450